MTDALTDLFGKTVPASDTKRLPASRPFSVRLSISERERLEEAAGATPLGTYVRHRLLATAMPQGRRRQSRPDAAGLGQVLGLLGRSNLYTGLADIGRAARSGVLVLTPEVEAKILAACADIREVRQLLFRALGLQAEPSS